MGDVAVRTLVAKAEGIDVDDVLAARVLIRAVTSSGRQIELDVGSGEIELLVGPASIAPVEPEPAPDLPSEPLELDGPLEESDLPPLDGGGGPLQPIREDPFRTTPEPEPIVDIDETQPAEGVAVWSGEIVDRGPDVLEVYLGEDGWRWRRQAPNGEIVSTGEAYTRKYDAKRAAARSNPDLEPVVLEPEP